MISDRNALDWPNLILHLTRHDLNIRAGDFDACIETGLVMHIRNDSAEAIAGANGAIVWSLRARVAICGPAKRMSGKLGLCRNKRVFLLDAEPRLLVRGVKDFLRMNTEIGVGRLKHLAA